MLVEKAERAVAELISQISRAEIKLPELQRDFVWKPTQVSQFIDSLFRGYPSGSLLFWETDEHPGERPMAVGQLPAPSWKAALYLIDGQQRLTSLYRVFHDHPEAQIVYNVDLDQFKNQTNSSRNDPKWIKVAEILDPNVGLLKLLRRLVDAGCTTSEEEIGERLTRLKNLRDHRFHIEILRGFKQTEMAKIFVRVNSGGRHLDNQDLALAMLSADWPGVVSKLQDETNYWRRQSYGDIDVNFLARALAAAATGQGIAAFKPGNVPEDKLDKAWATVQRGLRHVVRLLKAKLKVSRSDVLPSLIPMIPLTILLGERPDGPMDKKTADAMIYWFLAATIGDRYSGATETKLGQDVRAVRKPKALEALVKNLGEPPAVSPASLAGRTKESPYFFLSLLVTYLNGAQDWWYGTDLMTGLAGDQRLEHHHIHPVATLDEKYEKADINDLANLIFISGKANRKISYRSPRLYFAEVGDEELRAHYIPLDESLRDIDAYMQFLTERRRLLADAMNSLLDKFRPDWLSRQPEAAVAKADVRAMRLVLYASAWDPGRVVFTANLNGTKWSGSASMEELESAVTAAGVAGIPGDVSIAGESVPVEVVEDSVELPVGPFILTGTAEEWEQVFERERGAARSLAALAPPADVPWNGASRVHLPVTSTD
ncbi:MAG TPA: DUF262 domain-containing protein [Candidatus Limnocylindrales bacterium]